MTFSLSPKTARRIAADLFTGLVILAAFNAYPGSLVIGIIAGLCLGFVALSSDKDAGVTHQTIITAIYGVYLLGYAAVTRFASPTDLLSQIQVTFPALPGI